MRTLALVATLLWFTASVVYAMKGFKTKKAAVALMEDERDGKIIPTVIKAEPILPKSLEARLLAMSAKDSLDDPELTGGALQQPVATHAAPPPPPGAVDSPMVSIFDLAPPPPPPPSGGGGAMTVADALQGVALPCDLVPLVLADNPVIDPHHVTFITRGFQPAAVAVALRDALVTASYEFRSTGPMTAVATRERCTLAVTVHDAPSTELVGNEKRYPSASLDSVVVEIASTS